MRNMLALAALALIGFAAIGYFRGWYSIESVPGTAGGRHIEIDVNSNKITQDIKASKDKLRNLLNSDKKNEPTPGPYLPSIPGVPTGFRNPNSTPAVPHDSIDISDDGWWPSASQRK